MTLRELIRLIDDRVVEDATEAKGIYRLTSVTVYDNLKGGAVYNDTIGGLTYACKKRLKDFVLSQIITDYLNEKGYDDYSLEVMGSNTEGLPYGLTWQTYK
jgi:hypothetical protein